jgi:hypothetical protein
LPLVHATRKNASKMNKKYLFIFSSTNPYSEIFNLWNSALG